MTLAIVKVITKTLYSINPLHNPLIDNGPIYLPPFKNHTSHFSSRFSSFSIPFLLDFSIFPYFFPRSTGLLGGARLPGALRHHAPHQPRHGAAKQWQRVGCAVDRSQFPGDGGGSPRSPSGAAADGGHHGATGATGVQARHWDWNEVGVWICGISRIEVS